MSFLASPLNFGTNQNSFKAGEMVQEDAHVLAK